VRVRVCVCVCVCVVLICNSKATGLYCCSRQEMLQYPLNVRAQRGFNMVSKLFAFFANFP
jgi:hypothetical protein